MNKSSPTTAVQGARSVLDRKGGEDKNTKASAGSARTKTAAGSLFADTQLFYVRQPCLHDYEPFKVSYTAVSPMSARPCRCIRLRGNHMGNSLPGWQDRQDRLSNKEQFSCVGALATAAAWCSTERSKAIEAVDAKTGKELYKFKTRPASSEVTTMRTAAAVCGVLSGVGGWAGIGLAAV